MRDARPLTTALLIFCLCVLPLTTWAAIGGAASPTYVRNNITCESPVRLAHDCSIWRGATRPIAFGQYRMRVAGGNNGRTILMSRLRPGPDHNRNAFCPNVSIHNAGADAIRLIGSVLEDKGIRLERLRAVRRGQRIDGWFLEFSGNAYDNLKKYTELESEYWLPAATRN